jgi:hypothetical protein
MHTVTALERIFLPLLQGQNETRPESLKKREAA